jgi:serine protease Do
MAILLSLFVPVLGNAGEGPLTHSQIAEANKPGTVLIKTVWTSKVRLNKEKIAFDALVARIRYQVALGIVPRNPSAMAKAVFDELLQHPSEYFLPSEDAIALTFKTVVTGSGFIVTPDGYIVTNAHVVEADNHTVIEAALRSWDQSQLKEVFASDLDNLLEAFKAFPVIDERVFRDNFNAFLVGEQQYWARNMQIQDTRTQVFAEMGVAVPGLDTFLKDIPCEVRRLGQVTPGKDVAVLKVDKDNLPTVAVGDDTTLKVGAPLLVIGYPGAADWDRMRRSSESTVTQGDLSARKEMPGGGWSVLQTSADINHGNSGGPVFNDRGEVVGIATFGPMDESAKGINFLIPISVAKGFLDELNVKPHQSRSSELYREALTDMEKNRYKAGLERFREVSELSPGFPFVADKITQCRKAIDQGLDRSWMFAHPYLVGAPVVLFALLFSVVVWSRRRVSQMDLEPLEDEAPAIVGTGVPQ